MNVENSGWFVGGVFLICTVDMYPALADRAVVWRPCRARGFKGSK